MLTSSPAPAEFEDLGREVEELAVGHGQLLQRGHQAPMAADHPLQQAFVTEAELRAMVERKRRNDFVRKRELDMLRRKPLGTTAEIIERLHAAGAPHGRLGPAVP